MAKELKPGSHAKVWNSPICWGCDRKLYRGGRSYVVVKDEQGIDRAYHHGCVDENGVPKEAFGALP